MSDSLRVRTPFNQQSWHTIAMQPVSQPNHTTRLSHIWTASYTDIHRNAEALAALMYIRLLR